MANFIAHARMTKYLLYLLMILATRNLCSQPTNQPFTDVISAPATEIKAGSIVRLDITIKNNSNERIFLSDNRLEPEKAGIFISDSNGGRLLPRDEFSRRDVIRSGMLMAVEPGKSVTESVDLNRWFDLTKPGQYTVQARKRIPGTKSFVESNKLTITITP